MGVPPWEFTRPLPPDEDRERALWLVRCMEFRGMEASVSVKRDTRG